MDTFKEQIIKMNSTPKTVFLRLLIWLAALLLCTVAIMNIRFLGALIVIIVFLLFYGAVKLSKLLSTEYEYIFTNGDLDIDKITAQSSRKRIASFKCSDIESIGKYQKGMTLNGKQLFCCNENDEAYYIITRDQHGAALCVIFAPNDKIKEAMRDYIPRILRRDAF